MSRLRTGLLLCWQVFLLCGILPAQEDTGTYRILDYKVTLIPHSDGRVDMTYYQKWEVTGGHIPWITVGLPNAAYSLDSGRISGNVQRVSPNNSGSWSGVRINLDRDYRPGETFEIGFSLIQNRLFYADEDHFRLEFTPGWYNRAETDRLEVRVRIFAPMGTVIADPEPDRIEGEELVWIRNLGRGGRFETSIAIPRTSMPQMSAAALEKERETGSSLEDFLTIIIIVLIILLVIYIARKAGGGYGGGGGIYYGGRGGGRRGGGGGGFRGRSAGGGGGFGGRSISCACACVSCACACACAGGGGAGCSRKIDHDCPVCRGKRGKPE